VWFQNEGDGNMMPVSIAIDGPAGAGKSTVARMVAKRLNWMYVDTGAMYRAIAFLCARSGVDPEDAQEVEAILQQHEIEFEEGSDGGLRVFVDGSDVTDHLRDPDVSSLVSAVAAHGAVRDRLTEWQRAFAKRYSVVMDGRDIGTVVLPNAAVKVFLTAQPEERARRRQSEFLQQGFHVPLDEIVQSVIERDRRDSEREIAPLRQAEDAVRIDSTNKTVEQIVDQILQLVAAHVR
jgi:cytidylate kinase